MRSRFSVIITCYNQRGFIREAVNSALQQAFGDPEIIVVDDGSSDGSLEILKEYGARIKFVQMPGNGGAPRARNLGASLASGEYLVFLDGDDVLMPHALKLYDSIIEQRKPMMILAGIFRFSGQVPWSQLEEIVNRPLRFVEYSSPISKDRPADLSASATVVDRDTFFQVGGWTPDIFHGDNKDLMMKLGDAGPLILILEPKTTFYRVHAKNSIHDVSSFLKSACRLINNERNGIYPGGSAHVFERYAALGVFASYWSIKGLGLGLWTEVLKVVLAGFPMILAGIAYRCAVRLKLRSRPAECIDWTDQNNKLLGKSQYT